MDWSNGSNSENSEQERRKSKPAKPRVITKFAKRPLMQRSAKENIPDERSVTTVSMGNARKESVDSDGLMFVDSPNTSQTTEAISCAQTRLVKLESCMPAKTNVLKERSDDSSENSQTNNLTPANKRLSLLLKKMKEKKRLSSTSQSELDTQQSNNCSELGNDSSINSSKSANNDFIPLVDPNLQAKTQTWSLCNKIWPTDIHSNPKEIIPSLSHDESLTLTYIYTSLLCSSRVYTNPSHQNKLVTTPNDRSLSNKISSKDKVQLIDTPNSALPQIQQSKNESPNQHSVHGQNSICNSSDSQSKNNITLEAESQIDDKENQDNKKSPYQGRLAQLLQKLRNSSSVKSYVKSASTSESSVSFSSVGFDNFKKTARMCYNCGSTEHNFPACPEPQRRFCHRCGHNNVTVNNCPSCQDKRKNAFDSAR